MTQATDLETTIAQAALHRSQVSFNLAQRYYQLGFLSASATTILAFVTAALLLTGNTDRATVSAATALPLAITTGILREGRKHLQSSREQLQALSPFHEASEPNS